MRRIITFLALMVLVLAVSSPASAQDPTELPVCEGTNVTGTVVAVDEEAGLITVDPDTSVEGDECTVTLATDYDHPITTLLGSYFSDVNTEDLGAALESTQVCVVQDEVTLEWTISDVEPCEMVTVTTDNGDGTFSAQPGEGESITLTVGDPETSGSLSDALNSLNVDWELNEDGSIADTGDDIGEYHEDGHGFGQIVKVYAIIDELQANCSEGDGSELTEGEGTDDEEDLCSVTVEDLMNELDNGTGMGQLFKDYGKPSMTGVGHVRNAGDSEGDKGKGICNARANGGNANANGQGDVDCGTTIPNKDKDKDKDKTDKPDEGVDGDD